MKIYQIVVKLKFDLKIPYIETKINKFVRIFDIL